MRKTKTKYGVITVKMYDFLLIFQFFGGQINAVKLFLKILGIKYQFIRFNSCFNLVVTFILHN